MDYQTKTELYEKKKRELQQQNLTPKEYEQKLREFCDKIKF